jgi:Tol biopolymer transport system component
MAAGRTLPNMVIVPVGADGKISIFNFDGSTDVLVDVLGWFPTNDTTTPPPTTPPTTTPPPTIAPKTSLVSRAINRDAAGGVASAAVISRSGSHVAYESSSTNLVAGDTNGVVDVFVVEIATGRTDRVSLSGAGAQLSAASQLSAISDDGRFVAFTTSAAAVAGDVTGNLDVFRRDRQLEVTTRVSVQGPGGQYLRSRGTASMSGDGAVIAWDAIVQGGGNSEDALSFVRNMNSPVVFEVDSGLPEDDDEADNPGGLSVRRDGRTVAYAERFGGGGLNLFLFEISTGDSIPLAPPGGVGGGGSNPVLSDDGSAVVYNRDNQVFLFRSGVERRVDARLTGATDGVSGRARFAGSSNNVVFDSTGTNLVAGISDTNDDADIFFRTAFGTPVTAVLSANVAANGVASTGDGGSSGASMSSDGSLLVYTSQATDLATGAVSGDGRVLLRDMATGQHRVLDIGHDSASAHGRSEKATITPDARFVVFESDADDLTERAPFPNRSRDCFRLDRVTGQIVQVTVRSLSNGTTSALSLGGFDPDISDDGRFVSFLSSSAFVAPGASGGLQLPYVRDLVNSTTIAVGLRADGSQPPAFPASDTTISGNGRFVVFTSNDTGIVANDTNARSDVFVRDLQLGITERVNLTDADGQPTGAAPTRFAFEPSISADGRFVVFTSTATNLVTGTTGQTDRVYVRDRQAGTTTLVSAGISRGISNDGRTVLLSSFSRLVADDTDNESDVYAKDLPTGVITRINKAADGSQANGSGSRAEALSADGRFVTFSSDASNLVAADTNATADVFRADRLTGTIVRTSIASDGTQSGADSETTSVSADGRLVTFNSDAANLAPDDRNATTDVFVTDAAA